MNNKGQILGGGEVRWSRRQLLRATGAATVVGASGVVGSQVLAAGKLREVKLAWNANAICLSAAPVAIERGIFEKHGLKVELVNFAGSTDQLLETIATSKADAGLGMVHRWIKPLESGFDVKLVGSSHGGCSRLVGYEAAGVTSLQKLKGKTIAVSDLNSPGKNFSRCCWPSPVSTPRRTSPGDNSPATCWAWPWKRARPRPLPTATPTCS